MDQDNSAAEYYAKENSSEPKKKNPFSGLIPKGDYFFTPILININFLVFILMILSGVSPMFPDVESLIKWGAIYRPAVMHGEPWRLFTAMFLHCGILHIASNMYALFQIGRILEPFIGKWRFLALYIFAGLGGSAVSLWWHADSVGAGASGAIFGMFGVFAALLTTDIIDQSIRKQMLRSIGGAIALNLLIGLNGFIDNSAHIGGLLTGAIGGYLSYYDLKSWYYKRIKKYTGIIISGCITLSTIIFFWMITPVPKGLSLMDSEAFRNYLQNFSEEEKKAVDFSESITSTTDPAKIKSNVEAHWKNCLRFSDSMMQLNESESNHAMAEQLQLYSELRLEASHSIYRSITEKRNDLLDSARHLNREADSVVKVLNATKLQK